jgi:hypothetical protein
LMRETYLGDRSAAKPGQGGARPTL